jgi:hypothetical protein
MDYLNLRQRDATEEEVKEMEFYLRTGCVHEAYLKKVLGDISLGISAFSGKRPETDLDNKVFIN